MSKNEIKKYLIKDKIKTPFLTIDVIKTSSRSKYKNVKLSNRKNHQETEYKTIDIFPIKSTVNKNKLIIPKIIKTSNHEKNKRKVEILKNLRYFKTKNLNSNFINSNYFDINNNNYYVNLFNASTPKLINNKPKKPDMIKSLNSSRNSVKKFKYFNLNNLKKKFNQNIPLSNLDKKKNSPNNTEKNDVIEKMKNYRNKLVIEFMKYLKRFITLFKKKIFEFFVFQTKSIKRVETSYIYKKKIQLTPRKKEMTRYLTYNNTSKKNIKRKINDKNTNMKYFKTSILRRKIIINKKMNNKNKVLLNGEIKNIFLLPDNSKKNIIQKKIVNIKHSFKGKEPNNNLLQIPSVHNSLKNNVTEIEVYFRHTDNEKNILPNKEKINLRFNQIRYKWNTPKNKYKFISNNIIQSLVDLFSIICQENADYEFLEHRKQYLNNKKENKLLSSILEVDEKISGSLLDSIIRDEKKK